MSALQLKSGASLFQDAHLTHTIPEKERVPETRLPEPEKSHT
jgi:hypothetical protein